jgi:hypothetical protein
MANSVQLTHMGMIHIHQRDKNNSPVLP